MGYMFLLLLYAAMPLALSRDPGPTPSVGHVTGDMKRRESNETRLAKSASWFLLLRILSLNWIHSKINSGATFRIIGLTKNTFFLYCPILFCAILKILFKIFSKVQKVE